MTPAQCRAGRALLDWSQQALADASGVGNATIRNFEAGRSEPTNSTKEALRRALSGAGVIFVEENGEGPGVRLRKDRLPICVDASQPATLRHAGVSKMFLTLQEAVFEWHKLPAAQKPATTIQVDGAGGSLYKFGEIERLHYGQKPMSPATDAIERMEAEIADDKAKRKR